MGTTLDRALIATVGLSEEPLLVSIVEHEPEGVVLIASQDSIGTATAVRNAYPELTYKLLLLDDSESLLEAYQKSRLALKMAKEWDAKAILADISGGTKPMTAGTALALAGMGVTLVYVGGKSRDETGRVKSGQETVRRLEDPTERYQIAAWRAFRQAWNAWRMDTAAAEVDRILSSSAALSASERRFYTNLSQIASAMAEWDRFHHSEALERLQTSLPVALAIAEAWRHGSKVRVLKGLEEQVKILRRLVDKKDKPTFALLSDLLANAERRAESGRYDDALARLYRALELTAEADLYHRSGIVLRKPSTWPKELGEDLRSQASQLFGLKSVLDLAFDIDLRLGLSNTLAQRLRASFDSLESTLQKRHKSILAHGVRPVSANDYADFLKFFDDLDLRASQPWPRW